MIQFSQVCKRYPGGHEALRNLTFTIAQGEMTFLTGPSGAGKSTLLKLIAAIELPSTGNIIVNSQNVGKLGHGAIPFLRRNIGMVFQDHKLLYDRTAFDNVALPLHIAGFSRAETGKRVRAALDKVGLLKHEKALPVTLSGGEQQRLCIARAVVNRPAILIADEPSGNLDSEYANTIMDMFASFHQAGVTIVIATHDTQMIERLKPRVLHLHQGELQP